MRVLIIVICVRHAMYLVNSMSKQRSSTFKFQEFRIGDPEPVLDNLLDYLGVFLSPWMGYYEPPVSLTGLSRMRHANAHHGRCLNFKRNIISRFFKPNYIIGMQDFVAPAMTTIVSA